MTDGSIYETTKNRLKSYDLFSEATIKAIARLAKKQATYTKYQAFFKDMGLPKPALFVSKKGGGVAVVDIIPKAARVKGTIVLHLPMVNPLDENQLYHVATVVGANPGYRVIAFGNPSGSPYSFKQQNRPVWQLFAIAFTNNMRSLVAAELEYLQTNSVTRAHHVGYSYGAHKAMIEAYYAQQGGVASITLIDPVAHPRGFKQLIHDFKNTFHPLGEYVNRTHIPSYLKARRDAAKTNHHNNALKRPITLAIGVLMRRLDFVTMFEEVLWTHPEIFATVAWGGQSELGNNAHMTVTMHRLKHDNPKYIQALRLKDDKHAFANDIHLYAAIIRDALPRHGLRH